jgi:bifunctional non-homologous end joining protein LigD
MAKGDALSKYRAKRDFSKSPEPQGGRKVRTAKPRRRAQSAAPAPRFFCVQKHLASHLHYDFRLQHNGVLLSWAVPKGPSLKPGDKRLAMEVEAHPLDYGEFEGVIPEGYGAGVVMLWDRGSWTPERADVDAALKKGELKFRLEGVKLKGSWVLVRTGRQERGWLLIKHRDDWAGDVDVTTAAPVSVKSFGDFADILAAEKPQVWESHLAERGGAAGEALREVIAEAARRIARREAGKGRGSFSARKVRKKK